MTHWKDRPEPGWKKFQFNQPYAKGLRRLKEDVLAKTDFDPATLWQWGTMQAMALIEVLKDAEKTFGKAGQELVYQALRKVGLDVGRQILQGTHKPEELSETEFLSYYATVINRIAYASLEAPKIDSADEVSFDILWCPHQDHYGAFDCRVQRYFVQGMIDALIEFGAVEKDKVDRFFQVRFTSTIPAGAQTCHFVLKRTDAAERSEWESYTEALENKALEIAQRKKREEEKQNENPPYIRRET
jgi:hypothetical protein